MNEDQVSNRPESVWVLVGLTSIAMSTLVVEVALTKFFAYKIYHHFTYAVLSLVILGFGAAGVFVYLRSSVFGPDSWANVAKYGVYYAVTLMVSLLIFCWTPLDPYNDSFSPWLRSLSLPFYFILFTIPFFFAGVCVCYTLAQSKRPVPHIYFWDLLAAAVGVALCPLLMKTVGGYGTFLLAAGGGMVTFLSFHRASGRSLTGGVLPWVVFAAVGAVLLWYPAFSVERYGFDIRSSKDRWHRVPFIQDFTGIESTYWNAIARIDVSYTGVSRDPTYLGGLAAKAYTLDIPGRYILQDGGANTRQFKVTGPIEKQHYLGGSLWASPYVIYPDARRSM
ncbi:MAG: hypothetical protein V3R81_01115, partial [Gammaproteobacteria bacterium]